MSESVAPVVERRRGWQVRRLPDPPRWVAPLYAGMALLLIPWVVHLAFTLPRHTGTPHYRLAWIGFDSVLVLALARVAYLAIRKSPLMVNVTSGTAVLLVVDAWFDVLTAHRGAERMEAVAAALLLELPIAALTLWVSIRGTKQLSAGTGAVTVAPARAPFDPGPAGGPAAG